eukprot:Blabericola_migrator_1__547@NODE_1135_length_5322_cov_46_890200_g69_i2_p3_GENE_NODE_1135_length_5322_cov_46_890200_g69_i2NODE_1135_length_5322_cov_46_890200_g69_i2_p3_ORF_typecomplete_len254_score8_98_NODE_1135_length_5322_cov_46_890200_g69_i239254686
MVTDILSINEDGLAFVEGAERRCLGFIPVTQPRAVSRDPSPKQFWMFAVGRYACVQSDIEKDIIFIIPLDAPESTERRRIFRYADALPLSLNTSCVEHIITCVGWVRSHNSLCLRVCCLVKRLDESNARLYGFHVELEQKARAFSVGPPIAAAWTTPIPTHCQPSLVGAVLIPKVCSGGEDQIIVHVSGTHADTIFRHPSIHTHSLSGRTPHTDTGTSKHGLFCLLVGQHVTISTLLPARASLRCPCGECDVC